MSLQLNGQADAPLHQRRIMESFGGAYSHSLKPSKDILSSQNI